MIKRPKPAVVGVGAGRSWVAQQVPALRASRGVGGRLGVPARGGRTPPPPEPDGRRRPEGGGGKDAVPAWLRRLIRAVSVISGAATILFLLYQGADPRRHHRDIRHSGDFAHRDASDRPHRDRRRRLAQPTSA
jgi:hypothetical protein